MLRQIWRQRGAYNVVNLPFAASQDEPGGAPGRADRSADWRRHYNPSLEPEFREDVGLEAWDRANWYTDRQLSSTAAAKILRKRLETYGPQKERSLQEVFSRIRSEKDAVLALKAAELFRRYRASREQHSPFKNSTSKMIIERSLEADAGEVAVEALERKDELGFCFISLKAYRHAITHFSTKGDLKNVLKVFELAKKQGLKPNRDIIFCILRACLDCQRPDLAFAYAIEFEENGLRISPAQRVKIEGDSGKRLPSPPEDPAVSEASQKAVEEPSGRDGKAAVLAAADRIIAAATGSPAVSTETPITAKEASSSAGTSSTGEAEAVSDDGSVVPEAAVDQKAAGGTRVAAALSVDPEPDDAKKEEVAAAVTESGSEPTAEPLRIQDVPGLEAAVAEKMRLLFPPRPAKEEASGLRRANSV